MAKFIVSASDPKHYPIHSLPEFSLVGPSNSGKSTLINALAKSKIAYTSKKPGKTRTLNFYDFDKFYLVDMPGYGYAATSKFVKNSLSKTLDSYFLNRESILGVFQLCSIHKLSEQDQEVMNYLRNRFDNYCLLVNKADKISNLQRINLKKEIIKNTELPEEKVLIISGKQNLNIDLLRSKLISWI